jgi:SagB-type dehydrogenase family enzyme
MECTGDKIVISSPRLGRRLRVSPAVVRLLVASRSGVPPEADPAAVATLVDAGFLIKPDGEPAPAPIPWRDWGLAAWAFHQAVRDTRFVVSEPGQLARYQEKISARARPTSVRPPAGDRILLLPRVRTRMRVDFQQVLEDRRTHRHFADRALPLDAFSDLLHYSFAPLRFADAGDMGVLQLRAGASGGARHETEAFVAVFDVAGVAAGLYHYDNIRHGLVPMANHADRADFEHLTHGQGFFTSASFGVLTVAVADRLSWKYPHPIAYRMLLHNVGHTAQVFSMVATALGLGAAITGAFRNSDADRLLELDQPREFTTFALACGVPVPGEDGLPRGVHAPRTAPDYY